MTFLRNFGHVWMFLDLVSSFGLHPRSSVLCVKRVVIVFNLYLFTSYIIWIRLGTGRTVESQPNTNHLPIDEPITAK